MSPAVKNGILVVVVVGLIIVAVFLFRRGAAERGYPDDPELATQWMCDETGEQFTLTPAQFKEWFDSPDKRLRDPNLGKRVVFLNPKTGRYTVVRATVDPATKKWYIKTNSKGDPVPEPDWLKEARQQQK